MTFIINISSFYAMALAAAGVVVIAVVVVRLYLLLCGSCPWGAELLCAAREWLLGLVNGLQQPLSSSSSAL